MKRISADEKAITLRLSTREREALIQILRLYPVVPLAHYTLTKNSDDKRIAESQRLLDQALAEQRTANKRHVQEWLAAPERFQKSKRDWQFTLAHADSEWLLQVLNDVRVGNWLQLGPPEGIDLKAQYLGAEMLRTWLAMQMCGYFQMSILAALQS